MSLLLSELEEIEREIYKKYRYALIHIGIDCDREDVREAILNCHEGLEGVFQRIIEYWFWTQKNDRIIDYPNALLINALADAQNWQPLNWKDTYLDYPKFKSSCQLWWEEAANIWGSEIRNNLVMDVTETESDYAYILFTNGRTISLQQAKNLDWQKLLELAQTSRGG
jgi:hypothetical protein